MVEKASLGNDFRHTKSACISIVSKPISSSAVSVLETTLNGKPRTQKVAGRRLSSPTVVATMKGLPPTRIIVAAMKPTARSTIKLMSGK